MTGAVHLLRAAGLSTVAEYAYASVVSPGVKLIFPAGACPLDGEGNPVAPGNFGAQAAQCIANLAEALASAGATLTDVVSTRVLVASSQRADLITAWEVVRDAFGEHDVPSTLLGVTVLGYDDQLVEIDAVAALAE